MNRKQRRAIKAIARSAPMRALRKQADAMLERSDVPREELEEVRDRIQATVKGMLGRIPA